MGDDYHVLYRIEPRPEGFAKDDIPPGHGAADAVFLAAVLYESAGLYSITFMHIDGRTSSPVGVLQKFAIWMALTASLAGEETLPAPARSLCQLVLETVRQRDPAGVPAN